MTEMKENEANFRKKVLVFGGGKIWTEFIFQSDLGPIWFENAPPLPSIADEQLFVKYFDKMFEFDAVLLKLSGEDPNDFIRRIKELGLFSKYQTRNFKISFWSQDSHIFFDREAEASTYFDFVISSHSVLFSMHPEITGFQLPCSWTLTTPEELENLKLAPTTPGPIALMPFRIYKGFERNYIALKIMLLLKAKKVSYKFAEITGGPNKLPAVVTEMLRSKIIINISLLSELNMRTFEAIALNKILVSDKISDTSRANLNYSNTFFFDRDLSNLESTIDEALNHENFSESRSSVLSHNTMEARLREFASYCFEIDQATISTVWQNTNVSESEKVEPVKIHEYSPLELLFNSPKELQKQFVLEENFRNLFWCFASMKSLRWLLFIFPVITSHKIVKKMQRLFINFSKKPTHTH